MEINNKMDSLMKEINESLSNLSSYVGMLKYINNNQLRNNELDETKKALDAIEGGLDILDIDVWENIYSNIWENIYSNMNNLLELVSNTNNLALKINTKESDES